MEKPIGRKNYGSIPHLHGSKLGEHDKYIHTGQHIIMTEKARDKHDLIIVQEKYDGSNVGVAKAGGKIVALTRSGWAAKDSEFKHHRLFARFVNHYEDLFKNNLSEGERICGEWMTKRISIEYTFENPMIPFVCFDIFDKENNRKAHQEFIEQTGNMRYEFLPKVVYCGDPKRPEDLMPVINNLKHNIKAKEPEGLVYRVERNGKVDFLAKFVRSNFTPGVYLKENVQNLHTLLKG